ncbi:MAG TPA: XRE family transcriptional regulator [Vineibacter sp.]|nr:XRE family transcriptional regulator [Vineibacter sp.]
MAYKIAPIRTTRDHKAALAEVDRLLKAERLAKGDDARLEILTVLVDAYEADAFPVDAVDPVDLLKGHMANSGRTQADLAQLLGKTSASLVLNRHRPLSIEHIRTISHVWGIPANLLIGSPVAKST